MHLKSSALPSLTGRSDTSEEKGKFIADALRLAEDISGNQTFYTVKPVLNFWAAFTPSNEVSSGSRNH